MIVRQVAANTSHWQFRNGRIICSLKLRNRREENLTPHHLIRAELTQSLTCFTQTMESRSRKYELILTLEHDNINSSS